MIERKFINEKVKDYNVRDFIYRQLNKKGYSRCEINKTPLGVKIVIYTSKPGLVVGRGGSNIKSMTEELKTRFDLQSPQLEVREVENPELDANIMAGRIAFQLSRFGVSRFKSIGYRTLQRVMQGGAKGAEIVMSGKVPGKRSRNWRFYSGSLPKSGEISDTEVDTAVQNVKLKSGVVGVTVRILPPGVRMPDDVRVKDIKVEEEPAEEKVKEPAEKAKEPEKGEEKPKKEKTKEKAKKTKEKPKKEKKKTKKKTKEKAKKKAEKKEKPKKKAKKEVDYKSMTKSEIYDMAQKLDISGRSKMNKAELIKAVKKEAD